MRKARAKGRSEDLGSAVATGSASWSRLFLPPYAWICFRLRTPRAMLIRDHWREDEDILEIPMFVRVEWEVEAGGDEVGAAPEPGQGSQGEAGVSTTGLSLDLERSAKIRGQSYDTLDC